MPSEFFSLFAFKPQFVDQTLDIARPNLRVNGRNFEEFEQDEQGKYLSFHLSYSSLKEHKKPEEEPFDESLDRRVWSLSDQRLKWDLELALKRRETPTAIQELMQELAAAQAQLGDDNEKKDGKETDDKESEEMDHININERSLGGKKMDTDVVTMDLDDGGEFLYCCCDYQHCYSRLHGIFSFVRPIVFFFIVWG